MNMQAQRVGTKALSEVDATLRRIASLPAPAGLEERIKTALREPRAGHAPKLLEWPAGNWAQSAWVRGAAAAAIVLVVAGGSWGVYSRVQPQRVPLAMPHISGAGGFSSANAVRTPKTLDVPTVKQPMRREDPPAKQRVAGNKKAPHSEKHGVAPSRAR
jgi:hypothetical protein